MTRVRMCARALGTGSRLSEWPALLECYRVLMNGEVCSANDVIVVGAGIVGATVALELAAAGVTVTLIAPEAEPGVASAAAGAMLGGVGEVTGLARTATQRLELALRLHAASAYEAWHARLSELVDPPSMRRGTFVVATERPADLTAIEAMESVAAASALSAERVVAADVPGLRPTAGQTGLRALYLRDEAWIDAPELLACVLTAAHSTRRVHRISARVTGLAAQNGAVRGVCTEAGDLVHADCVVICAGVGTDAILQEVPELRGAVPRIIEGKGVSLRLSAPAHGKTAGPPPHAIRTPNREFACGLHVLPVHGGVYLGATNRVTRWREFTGGATAGEIATLVRAAQRELMADIVEWDLTRTSFGHRPLAADGLPMFGRTPVEGVFVASGTYRNGVLLAPLIADLLVQEMRGGRPEYPELSPIRALATTPVEALVSGLREFATLLADPTEAPARPQLDELLSTLGFLVMEDVPDARKRREQLAAVLSEYPLRELIPEVMIEACHPETLE